MNFLKIFLKKWNDFWDKEIEGGFEVNINLGIKHLIFILILIIGILWMLLR